MIHTDEDDEFDRIAHEAKLKGQSHYFEPHPTDPDKVIFRKPSMKVGGQFHVVCQCDKCKAQPQRTWVVLTDKEIEAIWKVALFADYGVGAELSNQPFVHYARAIEAKFKEKNNG